MYALLKHLHVACVVFSVTGFFLRGLLAIRGAPAPRARWLRALPHVNDTVLLAAALSLAFLSEQLPFVTGWVTAKVFGLFAYIILGSLALRAGSPRRLRIASWLAALAVFGWIVSVALMRDAAGFFAPFLR